MIIKSLTRKSDAGVRQLVKYIFRGVKDMHMPLTGKSLSNPVYSTGRFKLHGRDLNYFNKAEAEAALHKLVIRHPEYKDFEIYRRDTNLPLIITHDLNAGITLDGIIQSFQEANNNRIYTRSDSVHAHHVILSFKPDEIHLSDKMLKDMVSKFCELRGHNQYAFVKHTDKAHVHLHGIFPGTLPNGRSASIRKQEFQMLKIELSRYMERYPGIKSNPKHQLINNEPKPFVKNILAERSNELNSILQLLGTIKDKVSTTRELQEKLKQQGHDLYYRSGKLQGIMSETNKKYRFSRINAVNIKLLLAKDKEVEKEQKSLDQMRNLRERGTQRDLKQFFQEKETSLDDLSDKEQKALLEMRNLLEGKSQEKDIDRELDLMSSSLSSDSNFDNADTDEENKLNYVLDSEQENIEVDYDDTIEGESLKI